MTALSERLADLARRIDANVPRHSNPEAFHLEKDDIAQALKRIVRKMEERGQ